MFRLCRKAIFPRWHIKRQKPIDKKQNSSCRKAVVLCASSENRSYNDFNQKEESQHADRQDRKYWNDPQFHCHFIHSLLFETAGWLGTATFCFNYHKFINHVLDYDRNDSCLFSNIVWAMPRRRSQTKEVLSNIQDLIILPQNEQNPEKHNVSSDILNLEHIIKLVDRYSATIENVSGVRSISMNDKKAFRSFQRASQLGSSQAFYNLGLCYQLGKGTKVNLNMAAFCYRRAAKKGHGLASFNLAIFFIKGLGGLPIDPKLAKQLLAQAADKGVPEAQVYFGIEYLENKRWTEAVRIFTNLAEKNISDGQYYLGLCFENGFGVKRNEEKAVELYSKSAAQGNEKASHKLNYHNERKNGLKESLKSSALVKSNGLHVSSSVPELCAVEKKFNQNSTKVSILAHLDLITPFLVTKENCNYKSNFIGNSKITKDHPSTFIPFRQISLVAFEIKT